MAEQTRPIAAPLTSGADEPPTVTAPCRHAPPPCTGIVDRAQVNGTQVLIASCNSLQLRPAALLFVRETIIRGDERCDVRRIALAFGHRSARWAQRRSAALGLPAPRWLLGAALVVHTIARMSAGVRLKAAAAMAGFRRSEPLVRRIERVSGRGPTEWMDAGGLDPALRWYQHGLMTGHVHPGRPRS